MTTKASKETDVYSFGIAATELRRSVNPKSKEGEVILAVYVGALRTRKDS